MNKEFLEDYQEKEMTEFDDYVKKFMEKKDANLVADIQFPSIERFPKIVEPITRVVPIGSSALAIAPLYGSIIIPIFAAAKKDFKFSSGFDPDYIEEIVDFTKRNGRIHFMLFAEPLSYKNLDYLEPIFAELKPPVFMQLLALKKSDDKTFKKYQLEFETISSLGFSEWSEELVLYKNPNFANKELKVNQSLGYKYAYSKAIGHEEICDLILDLMTDRNYLNAYNMLKILDNFLVQPNVDSFGIPVNYSGFFLSELQASIPKKFANCDYEPIPPLSFEIGKFLLSKLAVWSDDFEAYKSIIDYYGQSDLHKLMIHLDQGIKDSDLDSMLSTKEEMNTVLDNLWEDSNKIRRRKNIAEVGLPIGLAVIGELASGFIGAGVLASLGYTVLDKIVNLKKTSITEEMAKIGQKSHLIGIHDFKTKYSEKMKGLENKKTT